MPQCAVCAADAKTVCGGCHGEAYCSQECQRKAWPEHKKGCGRAASATRAAAPSLENATSSGGVQAAPGAKKKGGRAKGTKGKKGGKKARTGAPRRQRVSTPIGVAFGEGDVCTICCFPHQTPVRLPCGHLFCAACLRALRASGADASDACPNCRGKLPDLSELDAVVLARLQAMARTSVARGMMTSGGVIDARALRGAAARAVRGAVRDAVAAALDATAHGSEWAVHQLARIAAWWLKVGPRAEREQCAAWLATAAEAGGAEAQRLLGVCYYKGEGVARDPAAAVEWFTKAAAQGHAAAQFSLGACYAEGEGVARDPAAAVEWYTKAAAQGHAGAQSNLAPATTRARAWLRKNKASSLKPKK